MGAYLSKAENNTNGIPLPVEETGEANSLHLYANAEQYGHTANNVNHVMSVKEITDEEADSYIDRAREEIHRGAHTTVYYGTKNYEGVPIAVKKYDLRDKRARAYCTKALRNTDLRNPFLVPIYAVGQESRNGDRKIIQPHMENGSLDALIRAPSGEPQATWQQLVSIMFHVSYGTLILHSHVGNKRGTIVHGDIKPHNILLDKFGNARLADVGVNMAFVHRSFHLYGSICYTDPYAEGLDVKPEIDIFAVGIVMLQVLTKRFPVELTRDSKNRQEYKLLWRILEEQGSLNSSDLLAGEACDIWPRNNPVTNAISQIAIDCLQSPAERIGVQELCRRLRDLLRENNIQPYCDLSGYGRCISCLIERPVRLPPNMLLCTDECSYFCEECIDGAPQNPLFCPTHGSDDAEQVFGARGACT